ncbi:hypothetical protein [Simkania sp.]|uniref:hypothetical protein n=1 Tax=Simkania sp. TaxID=34094 RepID=UPI003B52C4D6
MNINDIKDGIATVFKGVVEIPEKIEKSAKAIGADFTTHQPVPQTTSENVQKLVTSVMDAVAVVQTVAGGTLVLSSVYYIHSYFSTVSYIFSPITTLTMLLSGIITYDSFRTYETMKELNDWVIKQYPNFNDTFVINDGVYNRWLEFSTQLKYRTWLVEPIARPFIEIATKYFDQIKQGFLKENFYKGMQIASNPTTDRWMKAWQFTLMGYSAVSRVVSPPLRYIGSLWSRMERKALD